MGQTLDVIWVAVRAILQVFICVGVGATLAHMGHLGRETLTSLGKVRTVLPHSSPVKVDSVGTFISNLSSILPGRFCVSEDVVLCPHSVHGVLQNLCRCASGAVA